MKSETKHITDIHLWVRLSTIATFPSQWPTSKVDPSSDKKSKEEAFQSLDTYTYENIKGKVVLRKNKLDSKFSQL